MASGIVLAEETTGWGVRLVPDKNGGGFWVAKAVDDVALARLFDLAGTKPLKTWRGKNFVMAQVTDQLVHEALAALLNRNRVRPVNEWV